MTEPWASIISGVGAFAFVVGVYVIVFISLERRKDRK